MQPAGWVSPAASKPELFDCLSDSVQTGEIEICSEAMRDEAQQYIISETGKIEHVSISNNTPNHGDRVIAAGVVAQAMKDHPFVLEAYDAGTASDQVPMGSVAYRDQLHDAMSSRDSDAWDDRTLADMMGYGLSSYSLT